MQFKSSYRYIKSDEDISSKLCTNIDALTTMSSQSPNISLSTMMQGWSALSPTSTATYWNTVHCLNLLSYVTVHLK